MPNQHSMYENEHAEYLFAKVLAPHVCRMPVEQDRLDACHHLARLVEQYEGLRSELELSSQEIDHRDGEILGLQEQVETLQGQRDLAMKAHHEALVAHGVEKQAKHSGEAELRRLREQFAAAMKVVAAARAARDAGGFRVTQETATLVLSMIPLADVPNPASRQREHEIEMKERS